MIKIEKRANNKGLLIADVFTIVYNTENTTAQKVGAVVDVLEYCADVVALDEFIDEKLGEHLRLKN